MADEVVNTQAEEVKRNLPTLAGSRSIVELEKQLEFMEARDKLIREFIKRNLIKGKGRDYYTLSDTSDASALGKSGAEKLSQWFGYYADAVLKSTREDFDIGLFVHVYAVTIKEKGTNIQVGYMEGECSSFEPKYRFYWKYDNELPEGFNTAGLSKKSGKTKNGKVWTKYLVPRTPEELNELPNTIRRMAIKRGYVGAVIQATATGSIFAVDPDLADEEILITCPACGHAFNPDAEKGAGEANRPEQNEHIKDGEWKKLIKARYKSKFGSEDKPSKCAFCEKYHVQEGDDVVVVDGPEGKKLYGPEACLAQKWMKEHPAPKANPVESGGLSLRKLTPEDYKSSDRVRIISDAVNAKGATETSFQSFVESLSPLYAGDDFQIDRCDDATFEKIMQAWKEADFSTATVDKAQSAAIFAAITAAKKTVNNFMAFTVEFDGMYEGKGVKDILASDCDRLLAAWNKAAKEGAL